MLAPTMRPEFKADVYYVAVPEGLYLRGNASRLMLKGKSLYPLLERLIPHLTGHVTLEELTRGLDASKQRMIANLLEKLFTHGFLRDASQDESALPATAELERCSANQTFLASFQASAAARFEDFRQRRLLLLGCPDGLSALVQASLDGGTRQISALATPEADGVAASWPEQLNCGIGDGVAGQAIKLLPTSCREQESALRTLIQDCDAVVHLATRPVLARLLNRLCVEERKVLMQALLLKDQVWIGPLVSAGVEGCWECAWRRQQARGAGLAARAEDAPGDQFRPADSRLLTRPVLTLLAQQLIFGLFKHFTRTGSPETERKMSILRQGTGLSEIHTFLPHPHCQVCQSPAAPTAADFLEQIRRLQQQPALDAQAFMERLTGAIVDGRLGLFSAPEKENGVQMPLTIYTATLSRPPGQERGAQTRSIRAAGVDADETRLRAARQACTCYAAGLVDRRRLLTPEEVRVGCAPLLSAEQVSGKQGRPGRQEVWTWALDVRTRQPWLVPAGCVFPTLCQQESSMEDERGLAAGMSWDEAICQAMLDWCAYLTMEEIKKARQPYARLDLSGSPLTPEGAYLHRLLQIAAGEEIAVYDITGVSGIPTFVTCCGEKALAYSTHWEQALALTMGFVQALQPYQARPALQTGMPATAVPDFPVALRGTQRAVPSSPLPESWPERRAWLVERWQAQGLRALAVPLDHDPALTRVLPFIVRVLLCSADSKRGE